MAAAACRVKWADLEDSPSSGGAASSAARARWADLVEEEVEVAPPLEARRPAPAEASCGAATRDLDADSDCSTSADDGAEPLQERYAEVASDEDDPVAVGPAFAEAGAGGRSRPSRRRGGRAGDCASGPQGAAQATAAAQWQPRKGGGSSSAAQWRGHWAPWQAGQESWAAQGRWGSRKDASWQHRGRGQPRRPGAARLGIKCQCQFVIGIEEEPQFRVVRRLLGAHGKHVKRIADESGAKLRLRGRGSGFMEGPEQEESGDPLMLCVSAPGERSYDVAVRLLREHLQDVYEQHRAEFPGAAVRHIDLHEGPREGSF